MQWGDLDGLGGCTLDAMLRVFHVAFTVAGLGLRYRRMSLSGIVGHPLRKPLCVAFNRVEILGLHKDWCANFTALARARTECTNVAILRPGCTLDGTRRGCGAQPIQGPVRGKGGIVAKLGEVHSLLIGIGSVHKSVDRSLYPVKIT